MSSKIILVTAATGKIGKYLVPLLLQKNYTVHALVRSLDSPASRALGSIGAKLFKGDFDDIDSIKAAAKGAYGVLVNAVPTFGSTKEADHVENIVNASKEAGASAAVYISGFLLNRKEEFPNYGPSHPFYFINESKERAEKAVRQAGFEYWTILRPVAFMDNFFTDLAQFQWLHLYKEHILLTTVSPGVEWALVDPLSIAEYVESAFTNPEIFQQEEIELASDPSTLDQIALEMTRGTGLEITNQSVSRDEAASRGIFPMVLEWWEVINTLKHKVDMQALEKYPVKLRTFSEYLKRNKETIVPQFV